MKNSPGRRFAAAAAASGALLLTAGTAHADDDLRQITDRYLFEISLPEFVDVRAEKPYPDQLDWSSDSCSWSPDEPLGYDFSSSCDRHDFGYRNYKRQDRFSEDNRLRIDDNFKADMYSGCGDDAACKGAANVYYLAVRQFGGSSASTADALQQADVKPTYGARGEVVSYSARTAAGEVVEVR
ncbi:phospholipase [Saccharopolyspora taberi]|uniref:Phospholipase A2 n=1 Tax=Saccharopolyspora taberi TaxID=60895 RepID=A0ABN3V7P7_9PSEU